MNQDSTSKHGIFQYVKKTGPSLRNRLINTNNLALGDKYGLTKPCNQRNCKCCKMVSKKETFKVNNKIVKTATGNCSSYNIVYLFVCNVCKKPYVGRSTRALNTRTGEHRRAYYDILEGQNYDPFDDEFSLGIHLIGHNLREKNDCAKCHEVSILENTSPKNLEVKEHKYIHLLQSIRPGGINVKNPFNIPLLT